MRGHYDGTAAAHVATVVDLRSGDPAVGARRLDWDAPRLESRGVTAMAWTRSSSHVFGPAPAAGSRLQLWHALTKALSPAYRPELHYMRGPGPKWHEKHDQGATSRVMIPPRNSSATRAHDNQRA